VQYLALGQRVSPALIVGPRGVGQPLVADDVGAVVGERRDVLRRVVVEVLDGPLVTGLHHEQRFACRYVSWFALLAGNPAHGVLYVGVDQSEVGHVEFERVA
jgi:hypothetical protein